MAHILESTEIKKKWPIYNQSQKSREDTFGIFLYEDQNGYHRLAIEKNKQQLKPVFTFHYLTDGHALLRKLIPAFELCPRLCFLQTAGEVCEGMREEYCHGACEHLEDPSSYNKRVAKAIASLQTEPTFAIIENGLNGDDQSCVLVWKGSFYGMGYIPLDTQLTDPEDVRNLLTPYKENLFIRNLVNAYAAKHPEKVRRLDLVNS